MAQNKSLFVTKKVERTLADFKPTPAMIRWFKAAINPEVKSTLASISRESGVSESAWEEWSKDPIFNEWWNKEWLKEQKKMIWKLDKLGWDKARSDFKYWQAMQIKFGGMKDPAQQEATGLSANIFVIDFKKQLRGEDVEVRQVTRDGKVIDGVLSEPVIDESKRAVEAVERTEIVSETSNTSKLNPLDLIEPNPDEVTYKLVAEPNPEVTIKDVGEKRERGWVIGKSDVDKLNSFNSKKLSKRAKSAPRRKGKFVKHRSTFGKSREDIKKEASEKRSKKDGSSLPVL